MILLKTFYFYLDCCAVKLGHFRIERGATRCMNVSPLDAGGISLLFFVAGALATILVRRGFVVYVVTLALGFTHHSCFGGRTKPRFDRNKLDRAACRLDILRLVVISHHPPLFPDTLGYIAVSLRGFLKGKHTGSDRQTRHVNFNNF